MYEMLMLAKRLVVSLHPLVWARIAYAFAMRRAVFYPHFCMAPSVRLCFTAGWRVVVSA